VTARAFDFNAALVRTPARSVVDGLRAGGGPSPSYEGVRHEHHTYVAALRDAGLDVTVLPPLERFPDSMFVEDPALVFGDAAILLRPGAASRRDETRELRAPLAARFPRVLALDRGRADGGDVLVTPREVLIGLSSRTDADGAVALGRLLDSIDRPNRVVDVPAGTLHLKSDCALLDEESVLATPSLARAEFLRDYRVIAIPDAERAAANAVRINEHLFLRAGFPRTRECVAKIRATVVTLPGAEIAKIDAGLSCMSLRWFAPPGSR
jgi:dimethylargininase